MGSYGGEVVSHQRQCSHKAPPPRTPLGAAKMEIKCSVTQPGPGISVNDLCKHGEEELTKGYGKTMQNVTRGRQDAETNSRERPSSLQLKTRSNPFG